MSDQRLQGLRSRDGSYTDCWFCVTCVKACLVRLGLCYRSHSLNGPFWVLCFSLKNFTCFHCQLVLVTAGREGPSPDLHLQRLTGLQTGEVTCSGEVWWWGGSTSQPSPSSQFNCCIPNLLLLTCGIFLMSFKDKQMKFFLITCSFQKNQSHL